jgi:hypothetical protein
MAKKISDKTMAIRTVTMINQGGDVWKAAEFFGVHVSKIYKILREKYVYDKAHEKILKKSRENRKARLEAEALLAQEQAQRVRTVIVTETGYLMRNGVEWIMEEETDVYIPMFCIKELKNLRHSVEEVKDLLNFFGGKTPVEFIDLRGREELFAQPEFFVKPRTIGVVAASLYLCIQGYHVKLLTTSTDIQELAEAQLMDIEVIRTGGKTEA